MDFARIKPEGLSDRELLIAVANGVNRTHECVHSFQAEQKAVNEEAKRRRLALTKAVGDLTTEVGAVKTTQDVDSGRITRLAQLFGAERVAPGETKPKSHALATWGPLKVLGAIGGVVTSLAVIYRLLVAVAPGLHTFLMGSQ